MTAKTLSHLDDVEPYHGVDRIGGVDRYDYDANGNMTVRDKGLSSQQTLVWDAQNRLSEVRDNNGAVLERYGYDADGGRVRKTSGITTTYSFFPHYEEEVAGSATTAIRYYSFNGQRIAVKRGGTLSYLHGDHLTSSSLATDSAGAVVGGGEVRYYAYGSVRSGEVADLQTDRTFTGQKADATGLLYYNARYYDPTLGTFISPDSMVPDAGLVIDYNRFLYARGNPLRYTDPTGYDPLDDKWKQEFRDAHGGRAPTDQDRRDRLFSLLFLGSGTNGAWTAKNWVDYSARKREYWEGKGDPWPGAMDPGLERFAVHTKRLASHYRPNETDQFVKAFAFIFAGFPLSNPILSTIDMIWPADNWARDWPLSEGTAGWKSAIVDDRNPSHHYAGLFYVGFWLGKNTGIAANWLRDGPLSELNVPDLRLGDLAAQQGWDLQVGRYSIDRLSDVLRISLGTQAYWIPQGYPY